MYSRLQLLLSVADNPEHCPAKATVDLEVEDDGDDLDVQDVPVIPLESPGTEVPCYRADDGLMVLIHNQGDLDVEVTLHNGTAPFDTLVQPGGVAVNYHDGSSAGSVYVKADAEFEGTVRLVIV